MNLFENLQILSESENLKKYRYVGKVYKNDFKNKIEIGEIKTPLYVVAHSIGGAYRNLINQIVAGNQLFEIQNMIQIDKEGIEEVNEIPETPNNISGEFESLHNEEQINESIMSFDDWMDKNFNKLIAEFAETYEIEENEVYDNEDFDEYVNDKYEDYYRNTNRYINEEDEDNNEI